MRILVHTTVALLTSLVCGIATAQDVEPAKHPGLFGTNFLEGWKRSVRVGFTGTDGNVNETKVVTDTKGEYEDQRHRRKLTGQFYLSKPDNGSTDRKAFAEYEENWKPFEGAFYLIGTGRYDYDRFQGWDHRLAGSLGVGYGLIQTDKLKVRGSIGAGVSHTFDTTRLVDQETIPEGVVRAEIGYNLMRGIDFSTTHTYYPNLDQTDELRVISDAELKADIGESGGLNISLGLINDYDSIANKEDDQIEENALTYFLRLGYDF